MNIRSRGNVDEIHGKSRHDAFDGFLGLGKKHEHREDQEVKKNGHHQHLIEIDGWGLRGSH